MEISKEKRNLKELTLLALFVIYMSNGIFPAVHISALYRVLIVVFVFMGLIYFQNGRRVLLTKRKLFFLITILGLQGITILIHGIDTNSDLFLMLSVFAALLITTAVDEKSFLYGFRSAIYLISIGSVFFYILGWIFPYYVSRIPSGLLQTTRWDNAYTLVGTFVVRNRTAATYYRSFGIFSEPGQFQIFLSIGLIIELFYMEKPSWKNIVALLGGIVSCSSTNGYIVAAFIALAYFIDINSEESWFQKKFRRGLIALLSVCVILLVFTDSTLVSELTQSVLGKIGGLSTTYTFDERGTSLERRRAFDTALQIWIQHPIVGYGYTGMRSYVKQLNSSGFIMTCSPLNWFARYGTLYGIIANICYCFAFVNKPRKIVSRVFLAIALFSMISAQAVTADIIIWMLIFYGLENIVNRKSIENIL